MVQMRPVWYSVLFAFDFIYLLLPDSGNQFKDLLKEGPVTSSTINKVVRRLYYEYDGDIAIKFLSDVQFLTNYWMASQGYSTHILDSKPQKDMPYRNPNPDLSLQKTEIQKLAYLNKIRDSYRMNINLKNNGLIRMIASGSKGNEINYLQASFMLGQQALNGNRLKSFNGKRLTSHFIEPCAKEGGYVSNNFFEGLEPLQYFVHSIVGRSGVADTAVLVPDSGYLEKQLCKRLENVKVHYDGTVRLNGKQIIQRKYGGDGYLSEYLDMNTNTVYYLTHEYLSRTIQKQFDSPLQYFRTINQQVEYVYTTFRVLEPFKPFILPNTPKNFYDEVELRLNQATACAGTFVGTLAAHSISEPATQLSLNSIHSTGISSKAITGFPRMKQLTQCSEKVIFLFSKWIKKALQAQTSWPAIKIFS
jgi:hypothetical protein